MRISHFPGPVDGNLFGHDLRPVERIMLGQQRPERLADVQHGVEAGHALEIDPVPELRDAHLRLALGHPDRPKGIVEFRAGHPGEGRLSGRRPDHGAKPERRV